MGCLAMALLLPAAESFAQLPDLHPIPPVRFPAGGADGEDLEVLFTDVLIVKAKCKMEGDVLKLPKEMQMDSEFQRGIRLGSLSVSEVIFSSDSRELGPFSGVGGVGELEREQELDIAISYFISNSNKIGEISQNGVDSDPTQGTYFVLSSDSVFGRYIIKGIYQEKERKKLDKLIDERLETMRLWLEYLEKMRAYQKDKGK